LTGRRFRRNLPRGEGFGGGFIIHSLIYALQGFGDFFAIFPAAKVQGLKATAAVVGPRKRLKTRTR